MERRETSLDRAKSAREGERERERDGGRERERERERDGGREREREREGGGERPERGGAAESGNALFFTVASIPLISTFLRGR